MGKHTSQKKVTEIQKTGGLIIIDILS